VVTASTDVLSGIVAGQQKYIHTSDFPRIKAPSYLRFALSMAIHPVAAVVAAGV